MAKVFDLKEEDGSMNFTISNIDVSYVNAIRRTILSDEKVVVRLGSHTPTYEIFKFPKGVIEINTIFNSFNHFFIVPHTF